MLPDATSLPTLVTERLTLRWLTPGDVPALYEIFSDPEVTRYWSSPPLSDLAAAEALLADIRESFERRTLFQWGIARRTDDRVIGTCTLAGLTPAHRRAELGFALGHRHWGSGYVAEALPALVRFAFDELGLNRLEADVDQRNLASIRALDRLGFRQEGYLRERYHVNGEVQDAILYGLLRREWDDVQRGLALGQSDRAANPATMTDDARRYLTRQFDMAWKLASYHLDGLTTEECLWRPARAGLHVHRDPDGSWRAGWPEHEGYTLGPPSIAWLTWHLGYCWSMALDHSFGKGTLVRERVTWPGNADDVRAWLAGLHARWRAVLEQLTDDDLRSAQRTRWPFRDRPFGDVVAWANVELTKNAAEIGYARFLYAVSVR